MTVVDEAIALIDGTGFRMFEADLHRIRGEVLMTKPDPDVVDGEASLWKSLEIARAQNAKGLELRTATSLARLWQSQGKGKEAYEMLAPIYNWFTEGFKTKDLKDAKALLDSLVPRSPWSYRGEAWSTGTQRTPSNFSNFSCLMAR